MVDGKSEDLGDQKLESLESNDTDQKKLDLEQFCVQFDGIDDKEDSSSMSRWHKWLIVILISLTSLCVTCISSCWSLASENIMRHFNVGHEVSTLGISCYIWGLGTGGIFLSPISEYHGRKMVYILGLGLVVCFQFLTAFCNNLGGVLFGRFMSGFFGSSFMSVASGSFSDLFKAKESAKIAENKDANKELSNAMILYSVSPFIGPGIGPLISGFVNANLNFRWTFYIMIIWSAFLLILVIIFVPETYEPVLLRKKAIRIRKEREDERYYAPIERKDVTLYESIIISSKRPILLIFRDYMTLALCFYTGFSLAIVYLFFVAVPYIFSEVYNFSLEAQGMSFLGLVIGMALTSLLSPYFVNLQYSKLMKKNNGKSQPEFRFISLIIGVFIVPIGLFFLAWTTYSLVHWIVPIIATGVYGTGTILVFNGIFSYTVEAYRLYAASAMATNSFIRSLMSGVFPLFGLQMYKGMGIHWATTLLGAFACLMIPVPFFFYKYGEKLRKKSPYTWSE
ncbi:uncharacterized protein PRCAT00004262001 [Priceomyces carsonii]|uniref:uncharacterized protein n=1 Tax=Priceomyces carsonii TaxID=28549 RepID=UPI002EDB9181|nr:unnamed protein product [Priceomyces carsonii]